MKIPVLPYKSTAFSTDKTAIPQKTPPIFFDELSQKYNVDMPIVNAVYQMLYKGLSPKDGLTMLMTREKKSE